MFNNNNNLTITKNNNEDNIKKNVVSYSGKVNTDGSYRLFRGTTVISMCTAEYKNKLSHLHNYIKSSPLSEYFSPLSPNSYHMTVYNIWCEPMNLIPSQMDHYYSVREQLKNDYSDEFDNINSNEHEKVFKQYVDNYSNSTNHNIEILDPLMIEGDNYLQSKFKNNTLKANIKNIGYRGTIQISLAVDNNTQSKLNEVRSKLTSAFRRDDSKLQWHLTLAYRYKNIPDDKKEIIETEIIKLNKLVENIKTIDMEIPKMTWFNSMNNFYFAEDKFY